MPWPSSSRSTFQFFSAEYIDAKFDQKIEALDTKFDQKIEALDTKFDQKLTALQYWYWGTLVVIIIGFVTLLLTHA